MKNSNLIVMFALASSMVLASGGISVASAAGLAIGGKAKYGTLYAGISPDSKKFIYTTPTDAPGIYNWYLGKDYCHNSQAHGHDDWRVPSRSERNVLFENRAKGNLKGTFNETGSNPAGWYLSSYTYAKEQWPQNFSDGEEDFARLIYPASLRCVRG